MCTRALSLLSDPCVDALSDWATLDNRTGSEVSHLSTPSNPHNPLGSRMGCSLLSLGSLMHCIQASFASANIAEWFGQLITLGEPTQSTIKLVIKRTPSSISYMRR